MLLPPEPVLDGDVPGFAKGDRAVRKDAHDVGQSAEPTRRFGRDIVKDSDESRIVRDTDWFVIYQHALAGPKLENAAT